MKYLHLFLTKFFGFFFPKTWKSFNEWLYWKRQKREEIQFSNQHYQLFYTDFFNLPLSFYENKSVLDIGCGPRGSLEWATMASRCVGLDPLANSYLKMGADQHMMDYISANSEEMPVPDSSFDIITSFNSLDHVDDLDKTISEIKRVCKHGGTFLLVTDVNHDKTACEPQEFSWDVIEKFAPEFECVQTQHYEKDADGVYASLINEKKYDHKNPQKRYGILTAQFTRI